MKGCFHDTCYNSTSFPYSFNYGPNSVCIFWWADEIKKYNDSEGKYKVNEFNVEFITGQRILPENFFRK